MLCPDTELVPCWFIGNRDGDAAYHFMHDLAGRLANRVQITTDAHRPYLRAVEMLSEPKSTTRNW